MDVYIPPYMVLLIVGAVAQAAYVLRPVRAKKMLFLLALAGACMVLLSAWLERDVLLGSGQFFLLCILWRLRSDSTSTRS